MAYVIMFSNEQIADCFLQAARWLREPAQRSVNIHTVAVEVQVEDEPDGTPEVHHLTLCYNDGNDPPDETELAAYRAKHGRQL